MAVNRSRKARAARRRKRRMDRVEHDLSGEQWSALKAAWGGCAYCGETDKPLQRDCVLALSRGGRYTLDNIVPVCRSCNTSKCNDEITGWLRRKRLDERAFLLGHMEISTAFALPPYRAAVPSSPRRTCRSADTARLAAMWRSWWGRTIFLSAGSAEVRDCFGTQAVTGTWTSRRR
jgi:hypothetical protein